MNYYIIPKNNFNIQIKASYKSDQIMPYISHSLVYYLNKIEPQLLTIKKDITSTEILEYIYKIVKPMFTTRSPTCIGDFFTIIEIFVIYNIAGKNSFSEKN